jgi:hypothetical protein
MRIPALVGPLGTVTLNLDHGTETHDQKQCGFQVKRRDSYRPWVFVVRESQFNFEKLTITGMIM